MARWSGPLRISSPSSRGILVILMSFTVVHSLVSLVSDIPGATVEYTQFWTSLDNESLKLRSMGCGLRSDNDIVFSSTRGCRAVVCVRDAPLVVQ